MIFISCGTTVKVSNDYDKAVDFSGYKTFGVYDVKAKNQVSSLNADRITNSIKAEMIAKGFTESATPDLMVNPVTIMKDKVSVSSNTNYYGYGGMYRPYGYWGGGMGVSGSTTYNTYNYKDGSLIIDIVDAKTQKMVWQGTGNAEIDKAPKDPDKFISDAVKKILAPFPPGAKKK
jgi:stage V sporulation protein SpoVS